MKSLLRCTALVAVLGLSSCGGDVGVGFGYTWYDDDPWPNHPDWPKWPDHPQGQTGLYPIAGDVCGVCSGSKDGTGPAARFNGPEGIVADKAGNLYVAEATSATVRKVTPQGVVTTLAGATGAVGYADGTGNAARFNQPSRLDADAQGNIYLTDTGNSVVRKITASGTVTSLAGNGTCGSADGRERAAQFCNPKGIALDQWGNLWIADTGNHTVRRIDANGNVSTVAGSPGVCGSANGRGDVARFCNPQDIDVDQWGNVYVVDTGNSTIRMIDTKGTVTTLAGQAGLCGSVDGSTSASRLCSPSGIAVEGNDLYIADTNNATIRRINLDNVTSTVAGTPGSQEIKLGALPGSLDRPIGVARAPDGSFAITTHNIVVKLLPAK
jgi:sugar lactone lactonase YvrE